MTVLLYEMKEYHTVEWLIMNRNTILDFFFSIGICHAASSDESEIIGQSRIPTHEIILSFCFVFVGVCCNSDPSFQWLEALAT